MKQRGITYQTINRDAANAVKRAWIIFTVIGSTAGLVMGCVGCWVHHRTVVLETCANNQRMIDSASCQTAVAKRLKPGDPLDPKDMTEFLRGSRIPQCPSGGGYEVSATFPLDGGNILVRCPRHGTVENIGKELGNSRHRVAAWWAAIRDAIR